MTGNSIKMEILSGPEAFVKTFKRDYVGINPTPDAETGMAQLPLWFEHYNNLHPHKVL